MADGPQLARRGVLGAILVIGAILTSCGEEPDPGPPSAFDLDQPSVIDLLDGRGAHGTFSVTVPGGPYGDDQVTYAGRYANSDGGLTYTIADMDLALVRAEVARLVAMRDRFDSLDPLFGDAFLSSETVVTDHLQMGLGDVLLAAGVLGNAGVLATEPSLAFTAMESGDIESCQDALRGLRDSVRQRLIDDASGLGSTWEPDADDLGGDELDAVASACDRLEEVDTSMIEVVIEDLEFRVEVDGRPVLTIGVHPGQGERLTAGDARPAALLDRFGLYFLAIDRCGELPSLYSNFAASNSFTSPDDPTYVGPTPFGEVPVCEDEVPDD